MLNYAYRLLAIAAVAYCIGCADHFQVDSTGLAPVGGLVPVGSGSVSSSGGQSENQEQMTSSGGQGSGGQSFSSGGAAVLASDLDALSCSEADPYCVVTWLGDPEQAGVVAGEASVVRLSQARSLSIQGETAYLTLAHAVFSVDLNTRHTEIIAGAAEPGKVDAIGTNARFNQPSGLVAVGDYLYVADTGNRRLVRIDLATKECLTYVNILVSAPAGLLLRDGESGSHKYLLVADEILHVVLQIDLETDSPTPGVIVGEYGSSGSNPVRLNRPYGLAQIGDELFITERGNHWVRSVDMSKALPLSLKGVWGNGKPGFATGPQATAQLNDPKGIVASQGALFVVDAQNGVLRRGVPGGSLDSVAGTLLSFDNVDGPGEGAAFIAPDFVIETALYLYLSDNRAVRRIRLP